MPNGCPGSCFWLTLVICLLFTGITVVGILGASGAFKHDDCQSAATTNNLLARQNVAEFSETQLASQRVKLRESKTQLEMVVRQMLAIENTNDIAIDTISIDHTPIDANETRIFGHQHGPLRSARAMAIVQTAIADAVIISTKYDAEAAFVLSNETTRPTQKPSVEAAIFEAARTTLLALYPSHAERLNDLILRETAKIRKNPAKDLGEQIGATAANIILLARQNDGSDHPETNCGSKRNEYQPPVGPGLWSPDPISGARIAYGLRWANLVKPFVIESASQFRAPPIEFTAPPYVQSFAETKAVGGDGKNTFTLRTSAQEEMGIYFGYDGSPRTGVPIRMYNQFMQQLARQYLDDPLVYSRYLAQANIAMADAGLAAWESKWFYNIWRPVTAIRYPRLSYDTVSDMNWRPLGAPGSNGGTWFTPPFPSYPSGHAVFGAAMAEVSRQVIGSDQILVEFVSDEFNGVTRGVDGNVRPRRSRAFTSLTQFEEDNAYSRVLLGIHWRIDGSSGIAMGRAVAQHTLAKTYTVK